MDGSGLLLGPPECNGNGNGDGGGGSSSSGVTGGGHQSGDTSPDDSTITDTTINEARHLDTTTPLNITPDETPIHTPLKEEPPKDFTMEAEGEKEEEEEDEDEDGQRQIIVGICAMHKKCYSRPMQEILERLERFRYLKAEIFEEKVILKEPVENWPLCDCLISFHSKGFPLDKAVKYAELRKPMVINDLYMQYKIQDRRIVHQILAETGTDQPQYVILDRKKKDQTDKLVEHEDHIEVNDVVVQKPFVEKPISAEDHNVYIYFPSSAGGGSQRLFRKIGSRSSVYSPVSTVRKNGSFIYEEFMPTDGTDVKVYTVGPDYAHAEARKAPALDGKVERDKDGKEIRYPIILTAKEKLIARTVCLAFKQTVCGFDLLRANGKSYVCDVNGFSFVKTSMKYYDDCAKILGNMILRQLAPQLDIPYLLTQPEDIPIVPTTYGTMMELRTVIAVIRHGDRTPKQKMKMEVRHKKFFELFEKYGGYKTGQLKLKRPKQLQEILDTARFLLAEIDHNPDPEIEEKRSKLEQLKSVLEMYSFSGINRKVQLKHQPCGYARTTSSEDDCLSDGPRDPSLVLILKWGGELTPAGKIQAEELGKAFRCMYPGGQGDFGQTPGLGLLRLHSTFRHDLKIYASDEGRVQMTAAAFAKGFLALEGELTPILVQMVKSANMNGLLDNDNESSKYQNIVKEKLQHMMNLDRALAEEDEEKLASTGSSSLKAAIKFIKNPQETCNKMYEIMQALLDRIRELKNDPKADNLKLYHSESWELMMRRWGKLYKDFKNKDGTYDISKIPDIYDCIKYDLQHNIKVLRFKPASELYAYSKAMADVVIPQEYGITKEEKMLIALCICSPLLRKILVDLHHNVDDDSTRLDSRYSKGVSTPHRHVRTRLYFTSESHIHSLLTILRYGGLLDPVKDKQWARAMTYIQAVSELNYMTQIVIMMYEDPTKDPQSDERFHVEVHFSPGACSLGVDKPDPTGPGYRSQYEQKKNKEKASKVSQESPDNNEAAVESERRRRHSCMSSISSPDGDDDKNSVLDRKSSASSSFSSTFDSVAEETDRRASITEKPPQNLCRMAVENEPLAELGEEASASASTPIKIERHQYQSSVSSDSWREALDPFSLSNMADMPAFESLPPDGSGGSSRVINQRRVIGIAGEIPLITSALSDEALPCNEIQRQQFANMFGQNTVEKFNLHIGPEGWKVPSIRPLETLHNSLTLKQLESFLKRMTETPFRTPVSSPPLGPSPPSCFMSRDGYPGPPSTLIPFSAGYSLSSSSACSSGGPSSPTACSNPDDIMLRLKLLIDRQNEYDMAVSQSESECSSRVESPRGKPPSQTLGSPRGKPPVSHTMSNSSETGSAGSGSPASSGGIATLVAATGPVTPLSGNPGSSTATLCTSSTSGAGGSSLGHSVITLSPLSNTSSSHHTNSTLGSSSLLLAETGLHTKSTTPSPTSTQVSSLTTPDATTLSNKNSGQPVTMAGGPPVSMVKDSALSTVKGSIKSNNVTVPVSSETTDASKGASLGSPEGTSPAVVAASSVSVVSSPSGALTAANAKDNSAGLGCLASSITTSGTDELSTLNNSSTKNGGASSESAKNSS